MAATFENLINLTETSLAIQRLLIAPFPTAWTPARIDLASLPTGFSDLGAVVEDSPSFSVTRSKFQLDAGIPAIRQFEAVIGLEGSFEVALHSTSWRKIQFALGNLTSTASATIVTTIASVTNQNVITLATTSGSLPVGRQFVIATNTPGFDSADAVETRVGSVASNGLTYALAPTPVHTPTAGQYVGIYDSVCQFVGTTCLKQYVLLAVADFIDGSQAIHQFFKVTPGDEFTLEIRPSENMRVPLSFNALGVSQSVPPLTNQQLVIARLCYFPSLTGEPC